MHGKARGHEQGRLVVKERESERARDLDVVYVELQRVGVGVAREPRFPSANLLQESHRLAERVEYSIVGEDRRCAIRIKRLWRRPVRGRTK